MMAAIRDLRARRWRLAALVAGVVTVGVLVGTLVVPQYFSNADTTAVSTIYTTGTNTTNATTAASSDAPGGAKAGTSKPGDTLKWAVNYQNNTGADASVNLKDVLTNAGTYVPGSLQLPPNLNAAGSLTPQYTTNGGTSWANGTPPSNANGVGFTGTAVPQGTQQKSVNLPSPVSQTLQNAGGDGYNAVVSADGLRVYAVFHHLWNEAGFKPVYCAVIVTGAVCPGWPANNTYVSAVSGTAIGTGTNADTLTGWQNGTFIANNKLFWLSVNKNVGGTLGVACLDLATLKSCGVTQLDTSPLYGDDGGFIGGPGTPLPNGFYVFFDARGNFLCFNPATVASCGQTNAGAASDDDSARVSSFVLANSYYTIGQYKPAGSTTFKLTCLNRLSGTLCPGSWPVSVPQVGGVATSGVVAPILSATGVVTGACALPVPGTAGSCWSLAGAPVTNPYPAGFGAPVLNYTGDAYTVGTKVYLSKSINSVGCFDFATNAYCAGFTDVSNVRNYTVRSASTIAPNCLVADGDGAQIKFFNALTGGGCLGTTPATSMTVTPLNSYCGSGSAGFRGWGTLTIPGLKASSYTNSTVTLRDQNNAIITGFNAVTLDAGGTLSLATIATTVTSITATVTVNGVNDPTGVTTGQVSITWVGDPPQMCFQTTAPPAACAGITNAVTNQATAVTTTPAAGSDAPTGNSTGVASFSNVPDKSQTSTQCVLVFEKTSSTQSARPGDKVTYTIKVTNAGTQAYPSLALFTDDLTDVLKDATYNGDASASAGTVSYAAPTLSWSGGLAAGATATITYSVTVKSPDTGDHSMVNTVVSASQGNNNCRSGSVDARCSATVVASVTDVFWQKVDGTAAKNILEGAEWTFTPVNGSGTPTGPAIEVTDCVAASAASCAGTDIEPLGGKFRLTNLGPGTYQLVETRAPVGFRLNTTPILVTIPATGSTVSLADVVNKQLPVPAIPFTGGLGTDALTIAGGSLLALMLAFAGWHLIRRRRTA